MCKFLIVENTEPSGHLYEISHAAKAAECVTIVMQEEGKEPLDVRRRLRQTPPLAQGEYMDVNAGVDASIAWAEKFIAEFGKFQQSVLPWMRAKSWLWGRTTPPMRPEKDWWMVQYIL